MTGGGNKHAPGALLGDPRQGMIEFGSRSRLAGFAAIKRLVVPGSGEDAIVFAGSPAQVGIEFVVRLEQFRRKTLGDGVLTIADLNHEIVFGRVVAVVGAPVAAAQLPPLLPSVECRDREVIGDQTFARAHEID